MTREEAKEVFLMRGYVEVDGGTIYDADKWRESCTVISEWLIEQETILDKIKTEIEQLTSRYSISKERGGMGQIEWSDRLIKESDVLKIIDKYKEESDDEK